MLRVLCAVMMVATFGCSQKDPPVAGSGGTGGVAGSGGAGGVAGSGGTGGVAGTAGSGGVDAADYYPLVDAASWTYLHTKADQTTRSEDVTISTTTYEGRAGFLMVDSGNASGEHEENVLVRDGTSVVRIYSESKSGVALLYSATYENPGFVRFDDAWLDRAEGYGEDRMYKRTEYDTQGLNPIVNDRTHHFIVEALDETLTVPAGTFMHVVRIRRDRVGRNNDSNKQFWFAPNVGKLRELDLTTGDTEELTAYSIPGLGSSE